MSKTCVSCGHINGDGATVCANCQSSFSPASSGIVTEMGEKNHTTFMQGDIIGDRYEVVSELGRGGMGVVYRVKDTSLRGRDTALKMIHPELIANPEARHRFEDEVATCLDLLHPSIIRVYNLESTGELYFFTMEYLAGRSLSELIARRQQKIPLFSLEEINAVMGPLLSGLQYAHQYTIHRDLKPDNVMVLGEFPEVEIKILDFGIARTMSTSRFTQTAQSMGTPYYMAPEQLQVSKNVDHRADLYSVGMIIYEMLTGELAVGRFPLPSELVPGIPPRLDEIIEKTLSPFSDKRYDTAVEIKDLLASSLTDYLAAKEKREEEQKAKKERREAAVRKEVEAERVKKLQEEEEQRRKREEDKRKREEAERGKRQDLEKNRQEKELHSAKRNRRIGISIFMLMAMTIIGAIYYFQAQSRKHGQQLASRQTSERKRASQVVVQVAVDKQPKAGQEFSDSATGMEFTFVKGGCFQMGSPSSEPTRESDEGPVHKVCVDGFYMSKYEVTQGEYKKITASNPSGFKTGANYPVERVSWNDCQSYITKLNDKTGKKYRLPTEAEWEYAARGGTTTPFSFGSTISTSQANYDGNYTYASGRKGKFRKKTTRVGGFPANSFGLYDMHGNVMEWCQDWYGEGYYRSSPRKNPQGPSSGSYRVFRGGSWFSYPRYLRSAYRYRNEPDNRNNNLGFRLVLPVQQTR